MLSGGEAGPVEDADPTTIRAGLTLAASPPKLNCGGERPSAARLKERGGVSAASASSPARGAPAGLPAPGRPPCVCGTPGAVQSGRKSAERRSGLSAHRSVEWSGPALPWWPRRFQPCSLPRARGPPYWRAAAPAACRGRGEYCGARRAARAPLSPAGRAAQATPEAPGAQRPAITPVQPPAGQ